MLCTELCPIVMLYGICYGSLGQSRTASRSILCRCSDTAVKRAWLGLNLPTTLPNVDRAAGYCAQRLSTQRMLLLGLPQHDICAACQSARRLRVHQCLRTSQVQSIVDIPIRAVQATVDWFANRANLFLQVSSCTWHMGIELGETGLAGCMTAPDPVVHSCPNPWSSSPCNIDVNQR